MLYYSLKLHQAARTQLNRYILPNCIVSCQSCSKARLDDVFGFIVGTGWKVKCLYTTAIIVGVKSDEFNFCGRLDI